MTQPAVSDIPYNTSSHEQTGDIVIFTKLDEGNLVKKTYCRRR